MNYAIVRLTLAFSFIFHILLVNLRFAQDQFEIYEFGESGHIIKFPISQDEIDKSHRDATNKKESVFQKSSSGKRWVETFEFGESGHVIEFPMTEKEIAREKERLARMKKNRKSVDGPTEEFEIIEMADGHTISFRKN